MTVKVFNMGINKSVREIKEYLEENGVAYEMQNATNEKIQWDQFLQMVELAEDGIESLLPAMNNKKAAKLLNTIDLDMITVRQFYEFAVENPDVIKMPIVMDHKNIMVGLQIEEISVFQNRKDKRLRFNKLLEAVRMEEKYQLEEQLGYSLV